MGSPVDSAFRWYRRYAAGGRNASRVLGLARSSIRRLAALVDSLAGGAVATCDGPGYSCKGLRRGGPFAEEEVVCPQGIKSRMAPHLLARTAPGMGPSRVDIQGTVWLFMAVLLGGSRYPIEAAPAQARQVGKGRLVRGNCCVYGVHRICPGGMRCES